MIDKLINRLKIFFSTQGMRRKMWPPARKLGADNIKNCKILEDRSKLLNEIPDLSICAQIGINKGDFSREILESVRPKMLHLLDQNTESVKIARVRFKEYVHERQVSVYEQEPLVWLNSMPDETFDWIYIDGDHSYGKLKKILEAADTKIKSDGMITLNNYVFLGSSDLKKYNVIEATNEFCLDYNYELLHYALHGRMYNNVTIGKAK